MTSLVLLGLLVTCPDSGDPSSPRSIHGWTANRIFANVFLTRAASNMVKGRPGDDDVRPTLYLICHGDGLPTRIRVSVGFLWWVSRHSLVPSLLSLDGGPFVEAGAHGYLQIVDFNRPKAVIQQLLQHHDLVVRFRPTGQPGQDIHFELDGLDRVIWPLADACGWDPSKSDEEEVPNVSQ